MLYFKLPPQAAKTLPLIGGKSPSNCVRNHVTTHCLADFFSNLITAHLCFGDPVLGYLRETELKEFIQRGNKKGECESLQSFGVYNTPTYIISFNYTKGSADRGTVMIPDFQMTCNSKK